MKAIGTPATEIADQEGEADQRRDHGASRPDAARTHCAAKIAAASADITAMNYATGASGTPRCDERSPNFASSAPRTQSRQTSAPITIAAPPMPTTRCMRRAPCAEQVVEDVDADVLGARGGKRTAGVDQEAERELGRLGRAADRRVER